LWSIYGLKEKRSWSQYLTVQELYEAKEVLMKRAQTEAYGNEMTTLKNSTYGKSTQKQTQIAMPKY